MILYLLVVIFRWIYGLPSVSESSDTLRYALATFSMIETVMEIAFALMMIEERRFTK